jgi:hypothetical protein
MHRRSPLRRALVWTFFCATLLCLLLWVVSYWNLYALFTRRTYAVRVSLAGGSLQASYMVYSAGPPRPYDNEFAAAGFHGFKTFWSPPMVFNAGPPGYPDIKVWIPVNLLALLLLVIAIYSLRPRHRARRRRKLGLCANCGYDLTGNVTGTCPECGAPEPERSAELEPRPDSP